MLDFKIFKDGYSLYGARLFHKQSGIDATPAILNITRFYTRKDAEKFCIVFIRDYNYFMGKCNRNERERKRQRGD